MRRHLIAGLASGAFAVFALLFAVNRPVYFALLNAIHVHAFPHPFLDTRFVTAQVECWWRGIDVYVRNPCDPLGRTLDYSPLWLRLPFLARPDSWTPVFGLAIDFAFLAALFAMPWEVQGAFALVVAVGAVLSWATMFAMERGNTDLLMFAAAVLFAHSAVRSAPARSAGYALVLCAGLLKFYPLTLLVLLVREPARRMWMLGGLCALVLMAFVAGFHAELSRIGANMANGLFGDMFGARSVPFGFAVRFGLPMPRERDAMALGWDAVRRHVRRLRAGCGAVGPERRAAGHAGAGSRDRALAAAGGRGAVRWLLLRAPEYRLSGGVSVAGAAGPAGAGPGGAGRAGAADLPRELPAGGAGSVGRDREPLAAGLAGHAAGLVVDRLRPAGDRGQPARR